jgi:toxin FitB
VILDTNVISELARQSPNSKVVSWLRAQPSILLSTTAITVAELRAGVALLPSGKKRQHIQYAIDTALAALSNRIFMFDAAAAEVYGTLVAKREKAGLPLRGFDGLTAAIAIANDQALVTRNDRDFLGCGVHLINPWELPS